MPRKVLLEGIGKRQRIYKSANYKCLKCGSDKNLSLDHIVPKSLGGSNDEDNLQCLCVPCNQEKSNNSCADYRK